MPRTRLSGLLLGLLVALALATPATATERHLFPGGSFRNLAQQSQRGDTILVHAGSYGQFDVSALHKTGYVTVKAAGDGIPNVDGVRGNNSSFWRFGPGLRVTAGARIENGSDHTQFVGNEHLAIIHFVNGPRDMLVEGNEIHDVRCTSAAAHACTAVRVEGTPTPQRLVVRGNNIHDVKGDGTFVSATDVLVENNVYRRIDDMGTGNHSDTFQSIGTDGLTFRNNRAYDNDSGILNSGGNPSGWRIYNNLFARIESWAVILDNQQPELYIANNTFGPGSTTANGSGRVILTYVTNYPRNPTGFQIFNNVAHKGISIDPRLRIARDDHNFNGSPGYGPDYSLALGSPGIGAGSSLDAPTTDIDGRARTAPYNIGAYERVDGASPPRCSNGLDDDADGLADLADPGCTGAQDDDESNVVTPDELRVSTAVDRSGAHDLQAASLTGPVCVFLNNVPAKTGPVKFHLDGPPDATPFHTENNPPWDLNGDDAAGNCRPFNFAPGQHTITAVWTGGQDSSVFTRP
jgi:hypothetical protein